MLKMGLKGLMSSLWICILSCALASPALGKVKCGPGKTRAPKICRGTKRDVNGCCKIPKRKKRKRRKSRRSSNWLSGWLPSEEFDGIGLKSDYYSNSQGTDGSLGIAARTGVLGMIGWGGVGSVNYRFNSQMISGHAGLDAYLSIVGLQLALAWQIDQQQNRNNFGINYGLKLMLPNSYPMFLTIGGQTYSEAPTEFFFSYSIFTSL